MAALARVAVKSSFPAHDLPDAPEGPQSSNLIERPLGRASGDAIWDALADLPSRASSTGGFRLAESWNAGHAELGARDSSTAAEPKLAG